jgi:opacity protein-like surface antigen
MRIIMMLTVALMATMMMVATAAPAFAVVSSEPAPDGPPWGQRTSTDTHGSHYTETTTHGKAENNSDTTTCKRTGHGLVNCQ